MGSTNSVCYLLLNGYLPLWGLTSSLGDHPRIRISGVWPPESGLQSLASIPAKEKLDTRALGELSGSLHTGAVLFITSLLPGMPARSYSTGPVGSTFSIQWTSCVGQLEIIIRPPHPVFLLASHGLWDLNSLTRDQTQVLGSESVIPNHWTTRELWIYTVGRDWGGSSHVVTKVTLMLMVLSCGASCALEGVWQHPKPLPLDARNTPPAPAVTPETFLQTLPSVPWGANLPQDPLP